MDQKMLFNFGLNLRGVKRFGNKVNGSKIQGFLFFFILTYAERKMTGTVAVSGMCFNRLHTSNPFMSGIKMSKRISSGGSSSAASKALSPSIATTRSYSPKISISVYHIRF